MTLVCYIPPGSDPGQEYRQKLDGLGELASTEVFDSSELLARRLVQMPSGAAVALLVPAGPDDLESLLKLEPLLATLHLILVAPDQNDSTLAKGHRLRPRFLAAAGTDPAQVLAVTRRILEIQRGHLDPPTPH